jgi:SAM-dependent methyltransferase
MKIIGCLDSPAPGTVFFRGQRIEISGWGVGDRGGAHWMEARLDGKVIRRAPLNISRPDVLKACPPARQSDQLVGYHFYHLLPNTLALGKHMLEIHLGDEQGSWGKANACEFRVVKQGHNRHRNWALAPSQRPDAAVLGVDPGDEAALAQAKSEKLARMVPLLRRDLPCQRLPGYFDFLTPTVKKKYHIDKADQESAHDYDTIALDLIRRHAKGLILDCGAGRRSRYFPQVVNLEIVPYATTDVLAANEELPFADNIFDVVFSLSVLEHVAEPWQAAREIIRVLKPGGTLYCVAPFLQPVHAYPNHFFNMSASGLKRLFGGVAVQKQEVLPSGLPIWALTWMINSWAAGLPSRTREEFLALKLRDLTGNPLDYLNAPYVTELSHEKNLELACTTALIGRKAAGRAGRRRKGK